ncbi:MAG: AMP-binding protein, partial [bacterium]|nr:AMP-binding protein [bacterium]
MYEDLVESLVKDRDTSRNPLFDTVLVLQNFRQTDLELPDLKLRQYDLEWKTAKFDLTLEATETGEHLSFTFEYSTRLFERYTIERFARYFKKTVTSVLQSPGMKISGIQLISEDEKKQLLYEFNDTRTNYPRDKTIHELFEEQAAKTPNASAVSGAGAVTYGELNSKSHRLAQHLNQKGMGPGNIVAIMADRSIEVVAGILGILKSGAGYLPIDPDYPQERINFMLKDSGTKIIVTNGLKVNGLEGLMVIETKTKPGDANEFANQQTNKPTNHQTNLSYII